MYDLLNKSHASAGVVYRPYHPFVDRPKITPADLQTALPGLDTL
jgi:hypothetical protein